MHKHHHTHHHGSPCHHPEGRERGHGPEHQPFPHGRGGGHGGRHGGPGGRARRGEARFILMDTLRDGPKHGYEIIKALEEKSGGQYAPSPGTVYPTLQMLEDQGLVRSEQQAERRVYSLTEAGQAELKTRIEEVNAFHQRWKDEKGSPALQAEVGFLRDELELLARTVWSGVQTLSQADDPETVRPLRKAIEECRNEIRTLIATRSTIKGENV